MNDPNSEKKALDDDSQPFLFHGDKHGEELAREGTSVFIQTCWGSAPHHSTLDPHKVCLHPVAASGESISLTHSCTRLFAGQSPGGDEALYQEARPPSTPSVLQREAPRDSWVSNDVGPWESECQHNDAHSHPSARTQRVQPSSPGEWRYDCGDANGTMSLAVLNLEEGWEEKGEDQNTVATPDALGACQLSDTLRNLPQTGLSCGKVTTLPSSSSSSSEMCVTEESSASEGSGSPLGITSREPPEVSDTTYLVISDTVMQTETTSEDGTCSCSSEREVGALANGFQQKMTPEEEGQAPGAPLGGLSIPYTSLTEKTFDFYEDQLNGEVPLPILYGPDPQPLGCCPEAELPVDGPPINDSQERASQLNDRTSIDQDLGIQTHPVGVPLGESHPLDGEVALSSTREAADRASSPNDYLAQAMPGRPNETFSISSPEKPMETLSETEKNTQQLVQVSNRKLAPSQVLKPTLGKVLGKPAPKMGTPAGSGSLHKMDRISFPRPNFKNVKAKVISRAALQPRESAAAASGPRPPRGPPPAEPPLSSVPRKADRKADAKPENPVNKNPKHSFLKLITKQVVQITSHSRSTARELRATPRGGVPRVCLSKSGSSPRAGAGATGPHKNADAPDAPVRTPGSTLQEHQAPTSSEGSTKRRRSKDESVAVPLGTPEVHRDVVTPSATSSPALTSMPKSPSVAGRNVYKPDPLGLSKIPVPKMRVRPSVSCRRRSTEPRNFHPERALSPPRTKRASGSGASRKSVSPGLVAVLSTVEKGKQRHPRTSCSQPQSTPDPLSTEKALELASSKAKCEHQGKVILYLKQLLEGKSRKIEALAIVIQYLLSEREEALKHHRALSEELASLRGELVTTSAACEKLEKARNELQAACQASVDKLNQQHQVDLAELESQLKELYMGECERLQSACLQEVQKYKAQLQSQVDDLNAAHEAFKVEIESSHSERVDLLKKAYEASLTDIKECHDLEKKSLEDSFSEKHELLEKEIHDLKSKNDALNEKLKLEEQKAASREKANLKNPQIMYLERELESLKAVLEIKNEKLHQQDVRLLKMEKLVDSNTALVDKLQRVQQENEELKARMDKHMAISRQLSSEQAVLQESLEKESKVNKRLSMENEELLWKLHNGDLCSPKKSPPSAALPFSSPRNSASFPSPTGSPR